MFWPKPPIQEKEAPPLGEVLGAVEEKALGDYRQTYQVPENFVIPGTVGEVNGLVLQAGAVRAQVNGQLVYAFWDPLHCSKRATGEVLKRAVLLACLANPDRMRNFPCGMRL